MKTVVFAYGRFNPPTIGHEKLIKKVQSVAGSDDWFIIPSFKVERGQNPLPYDYKVDLMEEMFPFAKGHIDKGGCCRDPFFAMSYLFSKQKWTDVKVIAGQDRLSQYQRGFAHIDDTPKIRGAQNGRTDGPTPFAFNSIEVVSAGERDPDSDGVAGMSASKLRKLAVAGKTTEFMKGLPNTLSASYKVAVMNKVLENM